MYVDELGTNTIGLTTPMVKNTSNADTSNRTPREKALWSPTCAVVTSHMMTLWDIYKICPPSTGAVVYGFQYFMDGNRVWTDYWTKLL